jgi:hypothetical protein
MRATHLFIGHDSRYAATREGTMMVLVLGTHLLGVFGGIDRSWPGKSIPTLNYDKASPRDIDVLIIISCHTL